MTTPIDPDTYLPSGFVAGPTGELICPHRDVSCCPSCVDEYDPIVDVAGACFWIADPVAREQLRCDLVGLAKRVAPMLTEARVSYPPDEFIGRVQQHYPHAEPYVRGDVDVESAIVYTARGLVLWFDDETERPTGARRLGVYTVAQFEEGHDAGRPDEDQVAIVEIDDERVLDIIAALSAPPEGVDVPTWAAQWLDDQVGS